MRLFLDPRTGPMAYSSTTRVLRTRNIGWPFSVRLGAGTSGGKEVFLGSEKGARDAVKRLGRGVQSCLGELICVLDPDATLSLSEHGARFISPEEAERLAGTIMREELEAENAYWEMVRAMFSKGKSDQPVPVCQLELFGQ